MRKKKERKIGENALEFSKDITSRMKFIILVGARYIDVAGSKLLKLNFSGT